MPNIYPLFRHLPFDPEHVDRMSAVFEQVSRELGLAAHQDRVRDVVAKATIECAHRGIVEPEAMRRCVHEALRTT